MVTTIRGKFYSGNYICVDTGEPGCDYAFENFEEALKDIKRTAEVEPRILVELDLINLSPEEEKEIHNLRDLVIKK
ncbi:hypothetical protein HYX16_04755 [Candidatus Woesearchaeota archaeon]|nr:hypothetical protein [Candidatus Woesearchaeota archaeon]